jgi:hypothetical protein
MNEPPGLLRYFCRCLIPEKLPKAQPLPGFNHHSTLLKNGGYECRGDLNEEKIFI